MSRPFSALSIPLTITLLCTLVAPVFSEEPVAAASGTAQEPPLPAPPTPPESAAPQPKGRYTIIPGLKISPEIGIGFGTMAVNNASPRPGSRMEYRLLYTTRGQAEVRISNRTREIFGSAWEARFEGSFQRFPDFYFGGGNDPLEADKTAYSPTGGYGFTYFSRPFSVAHPAYQFVIGTRVEKWNITNIKRENGAPSPELVLGPQVTGSKGGVSDVWETGFEYDTRDNRDLVTHGWHAAQRFGTSLVGDFSFQTSETWLARYEALGSHWELAGKLWQKTMFGNPPFYLEPNLGNEDVLRGVPNKRFRDRSAQAAQAELRFNFPLALPIIRSWLGKDWQIVTFAETGRVGSDFEEASRATLHHSAGVGGRLVFNDHNGAMRGDLGFSEHGVALIVKFNQAF